mmetsp:Transcript_18727/g.25948  ORF Transcript_18727/g.25948 Transcript_18727/m.25948 type:complete len:169 (+) Transcript_18727:201-707(+)|eukprot:CAMPEP_0196581716 /NCGR_PEP_ID=MMETSP1081-20130531/35187_1 /TAXON_ID=36882 /ORGANISM="Pyramimonas amylifera, Strain CCMP720" /LENGTH=168 /DNA_ID=CAMNT_0041902043 /DNA_START=200 /DNA_END=706 /DNA_ORIENTATION=-
MSSIATSKVTKICFGEQSNSFVKAHLLPCAIKSNAVAPVSEYFNPQPAGFEIDGAPVLTASFRGRNLKGAEVQFDPSYSGYVLEEIPCQAGSIEEASWRVSQGDNGDRLAFKSLTHWNHDTAPTAADPLCRAMDWAQLGAKLHEEVPVHELLEMQKALAAGKLPKSGL